MGNNKSIQKINFEDIQFSIKNHESHILLNTLNANEQDCLLPNTVPALEEENLINRLIKSCKMDVRIIIYGRNCNDEKIFVKYNQLYSLGFYNIYVYSGGIFEWLLLQDIYGESDFVTTSKNKNVDIIKYKPSKVFGVPLLEYNS
jgi:hypothetical protein